MTTFDRILTADDVEQAVMDTIRLWIGTYLAEMERQTEREVRSIPRPKSWHLSNEFTHWPDDQIPGLVVISLGTSEVPQKQGDGRYIARWNIGVAVVTSANSPDNARSLAKLYTAAIRALMLQKRSLGGFARSVDWIGESYDSIPDESERSLASGQVIFIVEVGDFVNQKGNSPSTTPVEDPYEPPGDWPVADDVSVELEML